MTLSAIWRNEIDALEFRLEETDRVVVHRNVFRTLLGRMPAPEECVSYAERESVAFLAAAGTRRAAVDPAATSFHLNSRQIRRALGLLGPDRRGPNRPSELREPEPR